MRAVAIRFSADQKMQKLMFDSPRRLLLQTKVRMVGIVFSLPHGIVQQRAWHAMAV